MSGIRGWYIPRRNVKRGVENSILPLPTFLGLGDFESFSLPFHAVTKNYPDPLPSSTITKKSFMNALGLDLARSVFAAG